MTATDSSGARAISTPTTADGRGSWLRDFRIAAGRIKVLTTGANLKLDRTLASEALIWLGYHAVVRARRLWLAASGRRGVSLWFSPQAPRPWYLVWSALAWSGGRVAATPDDADAMFAFEDATWSIAAGAARRAFNFGCADISKSRVAAVFEETFGYPLAVDPTAWISPAVEKSELNGAHDGAIVECPTTALAGRHYQRFVDSSDGAFSYDLRTACVGGRPVVVWIKRKAKHARFSVHNLSATTRRPHEVFSADELDKISRFLAAMRIDWAGLDILRRG